MFYPTLNDLSCIQQLADADLYFVMLSTVDYDIYFTSVYMYIVEHLHFPLQGSVQFFVEVHDNDGLTSDDLVDQVYVDISLSPSDSFTSYQYYAGIHGNSRIELRFRVRCEANYYGTDCAHYCVLTDDHSGHYSCDSNGYKVCLSGWTNPGQSCTQGKLY